MERAKLALMTKDANRNPLKRLEFDVRFVKPLDPNNSLYHFEFAPVGHDVLEFRLAGADCVTFFRLLATILSPNVQNPHPPTATLNTADADGKPNGTMDITVAMGAPFPDGISLYSFAFTKAAGSALSFMLTNTDAGGMFYVYDCVLGSNPPNPPS